jgi:hypothetical protein
MAKSHKKQLVVQEIVQSSKPVTLADTNLEKTILIEVKAVEYFLMQIEMLGPLFLADQHS